MNDSWLPPVDRLISSFAGLSEDATPAELVDASRGRNRSLVTLLTWWILHGRRLPDCLARELDHHKERLAGYGRLLTEVRGVAADVVPAKGPSIACLYPAGLLRQMADLDLHFRSSDGLWAAAGRLVASGWSPQTVWAWNLAGSPAFHLELTRPSRQPLLLIPERVELTTIAYQGDHVWRPPRLRAWPEGTEVTIADCLVWLLDELGERRLRMRDLFDLAVLAHAAEQAGLDSFVTEAAPLVSRFDTRTQLRRLCREAGRHYPEALRLLERVARASSPGLGDRPAWPWPLRRHPRPASVSIGVALTRSRRPQLRDLADNALLAVQRRSDLRRLYDLGTPLYGMAGQGVPLANGAFPGGVIACFDADGAAWLDTPVGRFVVSLGPALRQEWIDRTLMERPAAVEVRLA
jgi:hypothetical protein